MCRPPTQVYDECFTVKPIAVLYYAFKNRPFALSSLPQKQVPGLALRVGLDGEGLGIGLSLAWMR